MNDLDFTPQKKTVDWLVVLENKLSRNWSTSVSLPTREQARAWKRQMVELQKKMKITSDNVTIYRRSTEEWYTPAQSSVKIPLPTTMMSMTKVR